MRTFPQSTGNRNVPRDSFLIAEWQTMSGEITYTVYATKAGDMFIVTDWVMDKPQPITTSEICRETLLSGNQVLWAWDSWVKGE